VDFLSPFYINKNSYENRVEKRRREEIRGDKSREEKSVNQTRIV